ncbi:MAG: hypothetical protein ABEI99_02615, partial [Halobaculum sp.]
MTIKRPQNKPISLEKANEVRKRANGQFRDKTGSTRDLGYTRVEASHETDVFSMVVHIDEAGQPATYLGSTLANKPTSESTVRRLHERAEAFRQNAEDSVANISQFADETSGYVSTARAGLGKDWRAVDSYNWDNYYQDYGYMQTGTDAGAYQSEKYFYSGAFTDHDNSPGVNEFSDSDFRQYRGWLTQDHDVYQGGKITLDKYAPQGDDTGDTEYSGTISVGL